MPKIVRHALVSSSEQAGLTASAKAVLRSYYCLCGDFVLVMQGKIDRLPQRNHVGGAESRLDESWIIRAQPSVDGRIPARKFKLNVQLGERCLLKRQDTQALEVRQNLICGRCNVTVAYQTNGPPIGDSPFVYVLKGAVTEVQGRIPPDAFEGEDELDLGAAHPGAQADAERRSEEGDLADEIDNPPT